MNAKIIEAVKGIRDNLNILIDEMEGMKTPITTAEPKVASKTDVKPVEEVPAETTPATKNSRKEREASEQIPDSSNGLTVEQLNSLSYNGLKRLAKEMGIPATGARDELTQKILAYEGEVPNPDAPNEEETPIEETSAKTTSKNRKIQKSAPVEEEPEDDESEEDEDPIVAKVNEAVEDMSNEEIADLLADVGVRAKGKRQSLISAVIKAVQEGKIDLDDEDSDEEDEEFIDTESETEEDEYDVNDPENPDMTKERKAALESYRSEVENDFSEGTITRAQIIEWLNEYHNTKDSMKKKSDDELVEEYTYYSSLLINDEGDMPEEDGAYTVNGVPYCCGHQLSYNEDNNTYICETCGAEYEADEE